MLGMLKAGEAGHARHDPLLKAAGSVVAPPVWQRVLTAVHAARGEPLSSGFHPNNRRVE